MLWYKDKIKNPKHVKQWHSGRYIVRWRDEFQGVSIPGGYHALIKTKNDNGSVVLDPVWRYKIFKTRASARAACEAHSNGLDPAAEYRKKKSKKRPSRRQRIINDILEATPSMMAAEPPKKRGRPKGSKKV